jgi:hypothetical protein
VAELTSRTAWPATHIGGFVWWEYDIPGLITKAPPTTLTISSYFPTFIDEKDGKYVVGVATAKP